MHKIPKPLLTACSSHALSVRSGSLLTVSFHAPAVSVLVVLCFEFDTGTVHLILLLPNWVINALLVFQASARNSSSPQEPILKLLLSRGGFGINKLATLSDAAHVGRWCQTSPHTRAILDVRGHDGDVRIPSTVHAATSHLMRYRPWLPATVPGMTSPPAA